MDDKQLDAYEALANAATPVTELAVAGEDDSVNLIGNDGLFWSRVVGKPADAELFANAKKVVADLVAEVKRSKRPQQKPAVANKEKA